jgi:hypothetical protein
MEQLPFYFLKEYFGSYGTCMQVPFYFFKENIDSVARFYNQSMDH